MYDDYPTAYETANNPVLLIVLGILVFIMLIIILISLMRIFKKANRSEILALIPIYNIIILLEITNTPKWYCIPLLIPIVNILFALKVMLSLAVSFRKSKNFSYGLTFLPFIFYPILAFGKDGYIGINLDAMEGKSIAEDIPKVVEKEENKPVVNEQQDVASKNINISIGGGVYQKDYTNTLLQVDQNQAIPNSNTDFIDNTSSIQKRPLNDNIDSSKLSFIAPIIDEKEVQEETIDISTNFNEQLKSVEPIMMKDSTTNIKTDNNINLANQETTNLQPSNDYEIKPVSSIEIEEEPSFVINPKVQALTDNELRSKTEFISCPKCGARIKSDAKVCFLCGRRLDQI